MKDYNDLVVWIDENVDPDHVKQQGGAQQVAFWFIAVQEAETLFDGTIKDNAHWIVNGIKPMDREMVDNWLTEQKMFSDEDCEASEVPPCWPYDLMAQLRYHFGSTLIS